MSIIRHHYHFTEEYIRSKSYQWRMEVVDFILQKEIEKFRWMLTEAQLSHTPMSKESSRASSRQFQKIASMLDKQQDDLDRIRASIRDNKPIKTKDNKEEIVSSFEVQLGPGESMIGLLG